MTRLEGGGTQCTVIYPRDKDGNHITMWNLIPQKLMPPTRIVRYCCQVLKETTTPNRIVAVGVRAAESTGRQGRDIFATRGTTKKDAHFYSLAHSKEVFQESKDRDEIWDCQLISQMRKNKDIIVNPIYEWSDVDIWEYARANKLKMNPLYDRGYRRVGCIGCPMAGLHEAEKEFSEYPKIKEAYIRAFDRMLKVREASGKSNNGWETGQDVFDWWIEKFKHECRGQIKFDFESEE